MKRIFPLVILIALLVIFSACSTNATDTNNDEASVSSESYVSEETGEYTYDDLIDSYYQGWNDACDEVFWDYTELYYDDYQYSYYDYIDNADGEPDIYETYEGTDYPYIESDISDAYNQGREYALDTMFSDTEVLCYGEDRYYRGDYL